MSTNDLVDVAIQFEQVIAPVALEEIITRGVGVDVTTVAAVRASAAVDVGRGIEPQRPIGQPDRSRDGVLHRAMLASASREGSLAPAPHLWWEE